MTNDSHDERPDNLRIFHDGVFLATLDYETAKPLIFRPAARRRFLAEHGDQAGDRLNGA
jgi:hypothetical protein